MKVCGAVLMPVNITEYIVNMDMNPPEVYQMKPWQFPDQKKVTCGMRTEHYGKTYILCEDCLKRTGLQW